MLAFSKEIEKKKRGVLKEEENSERSNLMYTVAMRGLVAFPRMVMHFDVARSKSVKAIEKALKENGKIFLVAQQDSMVDDPQKNDLFRTGVVAEIRQILRLPDNIVKVLVEGIYRANLIELFDDGEVLKSEIKRIPTYSRAKYDENEAEALVRSVKGIFENYSVFFPKMPQELINAVMLEESPLKLFETVTFNCNLNNRDKKLRFVL